MPRGAVLDFDGVLCDSMPLHAEAYRRVLAPLGIPVTEEEVFRLEGARSETIIQELVGRGGRRIDDGALRRLADEKQALFVRLGPPPLYPGAGDLVRTVRTAAHRLGLVTGTRRENLDRLIPDLLPLFDAVLAQDAYRHDKPHPEPYENSARALGLAPPALAALENAARGVESARRARYGFVLGIATTLPPNLLRQAGAHDVVPDHPAAGRRLVQWLRPARDDPGPTAATTT